MCKRVRVRHRSLFVPAGNISPLFGTSDLHEAALEVGPEARRLVALRLPVLNWTPAQVFVHLGDVYGCRALLVHSGGLANPEVDVGRLVRALALTYLVRE